VLNTDELKNRINKGGFMNKLKQEEVEKNGKKYLRTVTEIFSRVVGYIRPVDQWNEGKKSEYSERIMLNVDEYRKKED
jgi:anaerobic ribonucleoside-triphosphate reductase